MAALDTVIRLVTVRLPSETSAAKATAYLGRAQPFAPLSMPPHR